MCVCLSASTGADSLGFRYSDSGAWVVDGAGMSLFSGLPVLLLLLPASVNNQKGGGYSGSAAGPVPAADGCSGQTRAPQVRRVSVGVPVPTQTGSAPLFQAVRSGVCLLPLRLCGRLLGG